MGMAAGEPRQGADESPGIGMRRGCKHRRRVTGLYNVAGVHDGNGIADFRNHSQVVGNEEHRRFQFPAGFFNKVENLGLHRHVQGGGGFIGNEELGMAGQGNGYHHPLPHAAGKLVGIAGNHVVPVPYMHRFQHGQGFLPGIASGHFFMGPDDVHHLGAYGKDGIQAGHGFLKYHGHVPPPHFFHAFPADTQKLPAAEADGTVKLRLFSAGKEAGHRKGGHGFAAARLSHQSQNFSLSHM